MIEVEYRRVVPYSQPVVLSQYFDLEHLEHVHPKSFGRARMVSKYDRVIVWELQWRPVCWLWRFRSRFTQEYLPPWGVRALVVRGFLRGTESIVQLGGCVGGTLVVEYHRVAALPNWRWLRRWVRGALVRRLDRIWEEDLAVGVCRGGWPGVPESDASIVGGGAA